MGRQNHRMLPVRLRALLQEAQLETHPFDRPGQDGGLTGRAIAVLRQLAGHRVVAFPRGKEPPNLLGHLGRRGQVGEGADRHRDLKRGGLAAAPDNPGVHLIVPGPLAHHLSNETAEQGLALRLRQDVGGPACRQLVADGTAGRVQGGGEGAFRRRPALEALVVGRFGLVKGL